MTTADQIGGPGGGVEASVLLEFRMVDPVSAEVLDAKAKDVIEAVVEHAADTALAVNEHEGAIKLRFDVVAEDDAAILQQVSTVSQAILQQTGLRLSRCIVDFGEERMLKMTGDEGAWRTQWRKALEATAGIAPYLDDPVAHKIAALDPRHQPKPAPPS